MAKELQLAYITAKTVYAQVRQATGAIWNTAGTPAFETYATANVTDYDVALTENGTASGYYTGDFPSGINTAGAYTVTYFQRAGASPAEGDAKLATEVIHWTGSAVASYASVTLGTGAISSSTFAAGAINAAAIADGAIDNATLASDVRVKLASSQPDYAPLQPTTAGRTLDVSATGEAGIDWANVGSPTTTVGLTGTTISTSQAVASVSGAVGSVTGAVGSVTGNVGGNVTGSVGSVAAGGISSGSFASGAINAAAIAADAIGASELAADAVAEIQAGLATSASIAALNNLSAAQVNAEVDTAIADVGLTTTITGRIDVAVSTRLASAGYTAPDNTTIGTISTTLGTPAGASVSADIASVKTDTGNLVTRITSSLFSGITSLAQWLGLIAGKQTGNTTARTELRATGAGSGTFDEATDSLESVRDRGDAAWVTGPSASTVASAVRTELTTELGRIDVAVSTRGTGTALDAAGVRSAVGLASANLDTQLDALPTIAEVRTQCDDALVAVHLDHLLAVTYDPASKPGAADALLNELIESDAGVSRYTANALEQAPSGGGGSSDWTDDEKTAIRSILGIPASGTTPGDPTTGILDTIRDNTVLINAKTTNLPSDPADASDIASSFSTVNSTLSTIAGYLDTEVAAIKAKTDNLPASPASTGDCITAAGVRSAVGLASANLDTQIADLPTAAENATAVATQITTDHGSGSYVRNTEPATASEIASAIGLLGAAMVTIQSPVLDAGTLELVQGDDYYNADSRAVTITIDDASAVASFSGGTCTLYLRVRAADAATVTGTIVTGTGATRVLRFDIPSSTTTTLAPGRGTFDVLVTLSGGHEMTVANGVLTVVERIG